MTNEILKLNSNGELIAEDPSTGNTRPVSIAELDVSLKLLLPDATAGNTADEGEIAYDPNEGTIVVGKPQ